MKRLLMIALLAVVSIQPLTLAQEKRQEVIARTTLSGTVVYTNGTKKEFSDFRGLERQTLGSYVGQERFDVREGKLFFDAANPDRIVTAELNQVATISFGKKLADYTVEVQIVFKDGTKESFLARETWFDLVWVKSKLTERYKVQLFAPDSPFYEVSISFSK